MLRHVMFDLLISPFVNSIDQVLHYTGILSHQQVNVVFYNKMQYLYFHFSCLRRNLTFQMFAFLNAKH